MGGIGGFCAIAQQNKQCSFAQLSGGTCRAGVEQSQCGRGDAPTTFFRVLWQTVSTCKTHSCFGGLQRPRKVAESNQKAIKEVTLSPGLQTTTWCWQLSHKTTGFRVFLFNWSLAGDSQLGPCFTGPININQLVAFPPPKWWRPTYRGSACSKNPQFKKPGP